MKYLISLVVFVMLVGCASGPRKVRVKSCEPVGPGIYDCEEIPRVFEKR